MQQSYLAPEENVRHIACELWAYLLAEWQHMEENEQLTLRLCINTLFNKAPALRTVPSTYVSEEAADLMRDLARLESRFANAREAIMIGMTALQQSDILSNDLLHRRAS